MIKKYFSIAIVFAIISSICQFNVFAEISFPDMTKEHWAFQSVTQLVADGTIKGYEDGTFKPNGTVSRAEFVKMIGKSSLKRDKDFNDVSSSYWGYDYIMSSGLKGTDDNNFNPDVAITRADVAQLLWERAGSKNGVIAPSIITKQSDNKDAIAWIYQYGVMIGNDGINLRLNDTLSRAEAAALIIRSRNINDNSKQVDFVNTVSPNILETVFNSLNLFDNITYTQDKKITNGEMCRAGVRIASELQIPTYYGFEPNTPFVHPYVKDLTAIGNYCFSKDKISKDFIDKSATIQDTLAVLTFSAIKKAYATIDYSAKNSYYSDITSTDNDAANKYLTYANKNGVQLYANGKLNPSSAITLKEFSAILLQLDDIIGTQTAMTTDTDSKTGYDVYLDQKLQKNIELYPDNKGLFQCILADTPMAVYTTPFTVRNNNPAYGNPKLIYDFAREYSGFFTGATQSYKNILHSKSKIEARVTYFPSLVCQNGNAFTMRVKFEILEVDNELQIKDVFKLSSDTLGSQKIYKGMVFYCDIATAQDVTPVLTTDGVPTVDKIVYISNPQ